MSDGNEENRGEGLLEEIQGPEDLKELDDAELAAVAQELRTYIIDVIGGDRRPFRRQPRHL